MFDDKKKQFAFNLAPGRISEFIHNSDREQELEKKSRNQVGAGVRLITARYMLWCNRASLVIGFGFSCI